jgi:hypothetical protein
MKLQIIETPDYVLAVSDEEIKEGDITYYNNEVQISDGIGFLNVDKKIIAYQPKCNAPELDLPLLPEFNVENDVEKLAKNAYVKHGVKDDKLTLDEQIQRTGGFLVGFKEGYKAATKVYSEEDLRRAIIMSANSNTDFLPDRCDEIIQSIKQTKTSCFPSHCLRECSNICLYPNKTPKWFVAETEDLFHSPSPIGMSVDTVLKTTTINSKTYLVGTYLYE